VDVRVYVTDGPTTFTLGVIPLGAVTVTVRLPVVAGGVGVGAVGLVEEQ
jgi:hypothetical protein